MGGEEHSLNLTFQPVTAKNWPDFAKLFGEDGACGGCWCMLWRTGRSVYEQQKGDGNKRAMQALVDTGEVPGILAYAGGEPVGWCSVAPRESFPALERSRVARKLDDRPAWSVSCLFIHKRFRMRGVSVELLRAAVDYVRSCGGKVVEGYPVEPGKKPMPAVFAWTGTAAAFRKAGFVECARRSETRPFMRFTIEGDRVAR